MATVFQSIPTDRQPGLKKPKKLTLQYIIIIIIFSFSQVQKQGITGLKEHF